MSDKHAAVMSQLASVLAERARKKVGPMPPSTPQFKSLLRENTLVCLLCLRYRPWVLSVPTTVRKCCHVGWICSECLFDVPESQKEYCGFCIGPTTWQVRGVNLNMLPVQKKETSETIDIQPKEEGIKNQKKGWIF